MIDKLKIKSIYNDFLENVKLTEEQIKILDMMIKKETDKSFHYMVEALKDFTKVLFEEAETPQQKQMLRNAIQQSMM